MSIPSWLQRISPLAKRLSSYSPEMFVADLIGGCVVAIMLVPQAMAYAMLAGLPPQVGLYASIAPLVLYAVFGSSKSLAVGPVAMLSLLVVSGVRSLASPGSDDYLSLCLLLALLVGLLQMLMAAFRLGFLLNFISHPVLVGFTSAAAIIIGFSQLKHFLGVDVESSEYPFLAIYASLRAIPHTNLTTFLIGFGSAVILWFTSKLLVPALQRIHVPKYTAETLSKFGPLVAVAIAAIIVALMDLNAAQGVRIVGEIPAGLPGWTIPEISLDRVVDLMPLALIITLVGFLESFSVAKALASRDREKIHANRELFALGIADVGAAFTGGYPITGGFSRSIVSHSSGVRTSLGGIVTAGFVALALMFAAPAFYYIPKAVLAAIIIVAVISLIDLKTPFRLWRYSPHDAVALLFTFVSVLLVGIEKGIFVGICSTAVMLMWRVSRPHIAEVGRIAGSEHFRNIERHAVETHEHIVAFRFDASLNFSNAPYLENYVLGLVADRPHLKKILLIGSGINDIDATGIEALESICRELRSSGVDFYLSDVKGPVMDRLKRADFSDDFLAEHVFLSADQAMNQIAKQESSRVLQSIEEPARSV